MPAPCIQLLKESGFWETPYQFVHPSGIQLVRGHLPDGYNKLDVSFAHEAQQETVSDDLEDGRLDDVDEDECIKSNDHETPNTEEILEKQEADESDQSEPEEKGKKWRISRILDDGTVSYIHIKQAIKLLLPREYISRCRQRRHWASKHLPGKAPIDPSHNMIKFGDVALKCFQKGSKRFNIGRIEILQSSNDGSELTSFELKTNAPVRFRCSLYTHSVSENTYNVSREVVLTPWRVPSSLIGPVELLVNPDIPGKYSLHPQSEEKLAELGYICRDESGNGSSRNTKEEYLQLPELEEGFFEVEDILERRLCKSTLTYEYKVRFKGYGAAEDMWLPSSSFNRPIHFETTSKYGRKRRHKVEPEENLEQPLCAKRKKESTSDIEEQRKKEEQTEKHLSTNKNQKRATKIKKKCRNKGKAFRSTLPLSLDLDDNSSDGTQSAPLVPPEKSVENGYSAPVSERGPVTVINVDDAPTEEIPQGIGIFSEVLRQNDNFRYPRRMLAEANYPDEDGTLTSFTLSVDGSKLTDCITVKTLPPQSVLEDIEKELQQSQEKSAPWIVKITSYGVFDSSGIRTLKRFHRLKRLRAEVSFEKEWVHKAFENTPFQQEVTDALFDRWNLQGTWLASYGNYRISSQELSLLCGERYLSDEAVNFLALKYCDRANEEQRSCKNILLPSFLSTGDILESTITNICFNHDMEEAVNMFLPVFMPEKCHWGLAILSVIEHTVFFDDGFHYPIPAHLKCNVAEILNLIHEATSSDNFHPAKWSQIKRFKVPMPNQPDISSASKTGCGSCGVAVICSIRDICKGITNAFTWNYEDAPRLRAE